jgi:hypothetical protein
MTDTITESFCERCGTRYSFEKVAKHRRGGIGRVRVLSRGLKTFVANDGMPMAQAMAVARDDEDRAGISRQLEAFHQTFNFCMTCRQYTCENCWNEKAGECLTCAPDLTRDVLAAAVPEATVTAAAGSDNGHEAVQATAWPRIDLDRPSATAAPVEEETLPLPSPETGPVVEEPDVLARLNIFVAAPALAAEELTATELAEIEGALAATHPATEATSAETTPIDKAAVPVGAAAEPQPTTMAERQPVAAVEPEATAPEVVAEGEPEAVAAVAAPEVVAEGEPEAVAAVAEPEVAAAFEPELVATVAQPEVPGAAELEPALAEFAEPEMAAAVEPEPALVAEPEVVAAAEPEPVAAAAEPEVSAAAEPEPALVAEPDVVAAAEPETAAIDDVELGRGRTKTLFGRFRPGRQLDATPAAAPVAAAALVNAEPGQGEPPEPEPEPAAVAAAEPVPVAAMPEAQPEPEPVAARPEPVPAAAAPASQPDSQPTPPTDTVEQPTWRIIAPEGPTPGEQWPDAPAWPASPQVQAPAVPSSAGAAPWAARLATARPEPTSVWAASAQEVMAGPAGPHAPQGAPAVQACVSCGLSLSANARFCRRCGTRQA